MTRKEFNETRFSGQSIAYYNNQQYDIMSVDFGEGLIAINETGDNETMDWKRCENILHVTP